MRLRLAPIASRTASSRRREAALDSSRFAMFAHAINSTAPTTPPSSRRNGPHLLALIGIPLIDRDDDHPLRRRRRVRRPDRGRRDGSSSARACSSAHARAQAAEQEQPAGVRILEEVGVLLPRVAGTRRAHDGLHHHRHVQVPDGADLRAAEPGGRHADDREDVTVQPDVAADDIRAAAETRLPQAVADHHDRMRPGRHIVGSRQQPAMAAS